MSVLTTTTKAKLGAKAAKGAARNPGVVKIGAKATAPVAKIRLNAGKRRTRRRASNVGKTARNVVTELVTYGPQAAQELGLVETPKPKRSAPRVAAGVVIGAGAVYFLEPGQGRAHREQVMKLVS